MKRRDGETEGDVAPRKQLSTAGPKNPEQAVQAVSAVLAQLHHGSPEVGAPTNHNALSELCERVAALVQLGADSGGNAMLDIDLRSLAGVSLRLRFVLLGGGAVALHARRQSSNRQAGEDLRDLLHTLRGRGVQVTRVTVNDDDDLDGGGA